MIQLKLDTAWLQGLFWSWLIISVFLGIILMVLFVLPETQIYTFTPKCPSQVLYQKPCFLCGSTRAFVAISEGNLQEAQSLNLLSIPLFAIMLINELIFLKFLINKTLRIFY